jgi:GNAT superfamily N-acetyltransferase/predicted ABC-type ATPase
VADGVSKLQEYNPNHVPAGSPEGGQFASAEGGHFSPKGGQFARGNLQTFANSLAKKYNAQVEMSIHQSTGNWSLDHVVLPKDAQGQGIGSRIMREIIAFQDQHKATLTLVPALRDPRFGTTSRPRLVKFYRRFGFVENKGRSKDFMINADAMYRLPGTKLKEDVGSPPSVSTFVLNESADPPKNFNEKLQDALIRQAVDQTRYENEILKDLFSDWNAAGKAIDQAIRTGLFHQNQPGGERTLGILDPQSRSDLAAIVTKIAAIVGSMQLSAMQHLSDALPAFAELELKQTPAIIDRHVQRALATVQESALIEFNPYHVPAGSPEGGQFASRDVISTTPQGTPVGTIPADQQAYLDEIALDPRVIALRAIISDTSKVTRYEDPDRDAIHQRYYAEQLGKATPVESPTLTVILGPPASGKTTALRPRIEAANPNSVILDADVAKSYLPEHGKLPAALLHPESSTMVDTLSAKALDGSYNIIMDRTGNNITGTVNLLKMAKQLGYTLRVAHMDVNPLDAAKRAIHRAFTPGSEGRYVDPEYIIKSVDSRGNVTYEELKKAGMLTSWVSYDNNVPLGAAPKLRDKGGDWSGYDWR